MRPRQPAISRRRAWLFHHQKGRCFYCRSPMILKLHTDVQKGFYCTLEHVTPRCKKGRKTDKNAVAACYLCNIRKGSMTGPEWVASERFANLWHQRRAGEGVSGHVASDGRPTWGELQAELDRRIEPDLQYWCAPPGLSQHPVH